MRDYLSKFDLFPYKYNLPVHGNRTYRSNHSLILSVLFLISTGFTVFLFGQDFIFKRNPNSFIQRNKPENEAFPNIPISNTNFSIMFKFENSNAKAFSKDNIVFYPRATYNEYIHEGNKKYTKTKEIPFKTKPCLETSNKLNPLNSDIDLKTWSCFDLEDLESRKSIKPFLGGNWLGTDKITFLYLDFFTCEFDFDKNTFSGENCTSYKEIYQNLSPGGYYLAFLFPKISFEVKNFEAPLGNYYDYITYNMDETLGYRRYVYFDYVMLEDDRGWIFEDINRESGLSMGPVREEVYNFSVEDYNKVPLRHTQFLFYLNYTTVVYYRSFIKLQELVANIGGILKVLTVICGLISNFLGERLIRLEMVSKFYCVDSGSKELRVKAGFNLEDTSRSIKTTSLVSEIGIWPACTILVSLISWYKKTMLRQIWSKAFEIEREVDLMRLIDKHLEHKSRQTISIIR